MDTDADTERCSIQLGCASVIAYNSNREEYAGEEMWKDISLSGCDRKKGEEEFACLGGGDRVTVWYADRDGISGYLPVDVRGFHQDVVAYASGVSNERWWVCQL